MAGGVAGEVGGENVIGGVAKTAKEKIGYFVSHVDKEKDLQQNDHHHIDHMLQDLAKDPTNDAQARLVSAAMVRAGYTNEEMTSCLANTGYVKDPSEIAIDISDPFRARICTPQEAETAQAQANYKKTKEKFRENLDTMTENATENQKEKERIHQENTNWSDNMEENNFFGVHSQDEKAQQNARIEEQSTKTQESGTWPDNREQVSLPVETHVEKRLPPGAFGSITFAHQGIPSKTFFTSPPRKTEKGNSFGSLFFIISSGFILSFCIKYIDFLKFSKQVKILEGFNKKELTKSQAVVLLQKMGFSLKESNNLLDDNLE